MAMGENEQGFWTGALAGAGSGAAVGALGGPPGMAIGAVVGFIGGGILGNEQADSTRIAKKKAAQAAEDARRASIVKQMGAQQQAEGIAFAATSSKTPSRSPASDSNPGAIMGQNLTTSGTF